MMGRSKSEQGQLSYEFQLSDAVPEDHLVRKIDADTALRTFDRLDLRRKITYARLKHRGYDR